MHSLHRFLSAALLGLTLFLSTPAPVRADTVTVFAAASTTDALNAVAEQFQKQTGHKVTAVYGSSSTLAKQIEQGATAQVFVSANESWADYLDQKGRLVPDSRRSPFHNTLVVVAPATSPLPSFTLSPQTDLVEMLSGGRLAVGDPDHVPAGQYAKEALSTLGLWEGIAPRLAPTGDVRAALVLVQRGETPLGIVYGSDAVASGAKVKQLSVFPPETHTPITYPVALVRGQDSAAAQAFIKFLDSPTGQAVFRQYGFTSGD